MSRRTGMGNYRVESKQQAVRLVIEKHMSSGKVMVELVICKATKIEPRVPLQR